MQLSGTRCHLLKRKKRPETNGDENLLLSGNYLFSEEGQRKKTRIGFAIEYITLIFVSECDEYIRIFEYSNILVTNIYSDIRSYHFFFYEYIRTFVRVKFVCTNIFGHSLVSVLECKT